MPASMIAPTAIILPDGRRRLVLQTLEGKTEFVDIANSKRRRLRTWHELPTP
ncbi:MAG: hypothetical protein NWQ13_07565 [Glaciimonas sp.]|nr:hypothetical protein [Glaciimonas sp.]